MARLMFSFGILTAFAFWMANRNWKLASGSPPPALVATIISLVTLVNAFAFWASVFSFFRLMLDHFECPAIAFTSNYRILATIIPEFSAEQKPDPLVNLAASIRS